MPALTDIARYKRLAELFALAIRLEPGGTREREAVAHQALLDHGLTVRQAERFLEAALQACERNMLPQLERTVSAVEGCFRRREHPLLLQQMQEILEAHDEISESHQQLYDHCFETFYQGG